MMMYRPINSKAIDKALRASYFKSDEMVEPILLKLTTFILLIEIFDSYHFQIRYECYHFHKF